MDHITWILVADACDAKIFKTFKARLFDPKADGKDLTLISEHSHPEGRKKGQELVSDKQGNYGHGTYSEHTDPKRHEIERFALEISKILEHGYAQNHYNDLILIAPPSFMGMINKCLTHTVKKIISKEIEKDYIHNSSKELVAHLRENL